MNQKWFEMLDLRKKSLNKSVWIPLRSSKSIRNHIKFGIVGFQEEFLGHGSIMIPLNQKDLTKNLSWSDIGISQSQGLNFVFGEYSEVDVLENGDFKGIHLVLDQTFDNNYDNNEWLLHQDLVINLGLKREGDVWVCPRRGYEVVVRLERDEDNSPVVLEIKNQFLKDYLKARNCGLFMTSFFTRDEIVENRSVISWKEDSKKSKEGRDVWECRVMEIHEGGVPFGQKIAVSHVSRIDVDEDDDVPDMTSFPTDDNVKSEFYERSSNGKKLYRIMAELWKYEWINPANSSPITLGEDENIDVFYVVDAAGTKESGRKLTKGGKWLWFKPELISALLSRRGGFLTWYTKDTGSFSCAPPWRVHFGVNTLGLITVYAKDIGELPLWQQQILSSYNVAPDGGISKELHDSQVKAEPASTLAPEAFLKEVLDEINIAAEENLRIKFFREHNAISEIATSIHRFRAIDTNGLYSLSKDLARIIIDDIDVESIQKIVAPPKKTKWGSLKSMENLLASKIPKEKARDIMSPFVGIYELRHGDAHLPSSEIEKAFALIQIDRNKPSVLQGYQMLCACVDNLHKILFIVKNWKNISR